MRKVSDATADKVFNQLVSKIRNELSKEGVTQTSLGRYMGVGQSTISMWLSGKRGGGTSFSTIMRCYRALGGDMSELLKTMLGEDVAAPLIAAYDNDPDMLEAIALLLSDPESPASQRWRDLTLYLSGHQEKEDN